MLKDLEFLNVQGKLLENIISKYEIIGRFLPFPSESDSEISSTQIQVSSDFEYLGFIDSYSHLKMEKKSPSKYAGYLHYLADMLTLKFNLATCYSRMSSRMDLNWDETNNSETGVLQASFLYQKAAGIYCNIRERVV